MELTLELARQVLAAQPFSVLVGARVVAFGGGGATLEIDTRDELKQQNGFLHGGVLAYAADNAITFAAGTVLGPSVLTGGFAIDYLRPGVGRTLVARAAVVQSTRRRAVARCDLSVVDEEGAETAVAFAQGTVVVTGG
ncbi:PaaI family thioesterase [Actinophytocola sp. KF-1]